MAEVASIIIDVTVGRIRTNGFKQMSEVKPVQVAAVALDDVPADLEGQNKMADDLRRTLVEATQAWLVFRRGGVED